MLYKTLIVLFLSFTGVFMSSVVRTKQAGTGEKIDQNTYLSEVMFRLGEKHPAHFIGKTDTTLARHGMEIVFYGKTKGPDGKNTRRQSKHFTCIHCHNTVREDPDLRQSDPQQRLEYISKNKGHFLPASTFYGIVNRESWYNDDYIKKYGSLVIPAHDTLSNAIQVCATECSQGRKLSEWELQCVLHYF